MQQNHWSCLLRVDKSFHSTSGVKDVTWVLSVNLSKVQGYFHRHVSIVVYANPVDKIFTETELVWPNNILGSPFSYLAVILILICISLWFINSDIWSLLLSIVWSLEVICWIKIDRNLNSMIFAITVFFNDFYSVRDLFFWLILNGFFFFNKVLIIRDSSLILLLIVLLVASILCILITSNITFFFIDFVPLLVIVLNYSSTWVLVLLIFPNISFI